MKLCVIGTGYVGLVSGVCLAAKGHQVTCVDLNPDIVAMLKQGKPHFYEPGLQELLTSVINAGKFTVTSSLSDAMQGAEIAMIAVGTPSVDGEIDLKFVRSAAKEIGTFLKAADQHTSVIVKSTVVPGTTDGVVLDEIQIASGKKLGQFGLGMNPEFLREGCAIEDFSLPDRIVFGYEDKKTLERLEALYAPWDCDKLAVNSRTAELIKYANNALLAVQISAANEIANLSAAIGGIDILDVYNGVCADKRWRPIVNNQRVTPGITSYLLPGCGFGGSCFPKDVEALRTLGQNNDSPMRLLQSVLDINNEQPSQVVKILSQQMGSLKGKKVLVLGLAFKPDTDDVRETASFKIVQDLLAKSASIKAHDPIATSNFKKLFGEPPSDLTFVEDWEEDVFEADVIIIATKWDEYKNITNLNLDGKVIFDARRLFDKGRLKNATYLTIGMRTRGQ